jgi:hypothetical protein
VTSYDLLSLTNDGNVPVPLKRNKHKYLKSPTKDKDPLVKDTDPDLFQNVTDPEHCQRQSSKHLKTTND